ncbi:metal-dependent hydrolase [Halobacteriaceae bacterium SHR40]|uniref:metal-dependent hydrolase n=1 Tax=Halovenus amylolytica TaxID=2500550 RepID=UPI000FE33FC8
MMLPTHALVGMVLALPFALLAPEFATQALLAGFVGGILPDLDLYSGHRKSLHYPVYYSLSTVPAVLAAFVVPGPVTIAAAVLLLGASVHCLADSLGGGLELRPWEGRSNRAVYNHYSDRWIHPRRWVRYDGAPEDFIASAVLGGFLFTVVDGPFQVIVALAVLVAGTYTVVRRVLPTIATAIVALLPPPVHPLLPARYLEGQ